MELIEFFFWMAFCFFLCKSHAMHFYSEINPSGFNRLIPYCTCNWSLVFFLLPLIEEEDKKEQRPDAGPAFTLLCCSAQYQENSGTLLP